MKIFVLRHGKAVQHGYDNDFERGLNKKGVAQINQIGWILAHDKKVNIDAILSSEARRTKETALIMNHYLHCPSITFDSDLYLCDANTIFEKLSLMGDSLKTVLYIGHNNGISNFVSKLTEEPVILSTGNLIEIDLELNQISLISSGTGILKSNIRPDVLVV